MQMVMSALMPLFENADAEIRNSAGRVWLQTAVRTALPEFAEEGKSMMNPEDPLYYWLMAQLSILEEDYEAAERWLDQDSNHNRGHHYWRAVVAYNRAPGSKMEYEALREWANTYRRLEHTATAQRMVYLTNQYETPRERLSRYSLRMTSWARGTDVAQFTLANTLFQMGRYAQAAVILEALDRKDRLGSMMPAMNESIQVQIRTILEKIPAEYRSRPNVRMVDVHPPPEGTVFHLQPLGRVHPEILDAAAERIRLFSGLEVVIGEPIDMPTDRNIYNRSTRQYQNSELYAWLLNHPEFPEEADFIGYVFEEDLRDRGWIYMTTYFNTGITMISSYRWRGIFWRPTHQVVGDHFGKLCLRSVLGPFQHAMGGNRTQALTGLRTWPNHAGNILYSRGGPIEVVEAPFTICPDTAMLFQQQSWESITSWIRKNREDVRAR